MKILINKFSSIYYLVLIMLLSGSLNSSYYSLLLPHDTFSLITHINDYSYGKSRLVKDSSRTIPIQVSSTITLLPQGVNIGSFKYYLKYSQFDYYLYSKIVNYGTFEDSESGYQFNVSDYLIGSQLFNNINSRFSISGSIQYMYSNFDSYSSDVIVGSASLWYHDNRYVINLYYNDWGIILSQYSNYEEMLSKHFGFSLFFSPQYLNSIISINGYQYQNYYYWNLNNELIFSQNFSLLLGFDSKALDLYHGDFYFDILTGLSLGVDVKLPYMDFVIGFKSLGGYGITSSISIFKNIK